MRAVRPFPFANRPRRHFVWLLWLAMLLPLAQGAATWHAMSHAATETGGESDSDGKALHASHCALCLNAATIANGAAPLAPSGLVLLAASHAVPLAQGFTPGAAVDWPAYNSRAPPAFVPC